ncbi:hypothetical protein NWFMUON74_21360 [Nocardia wallacei]|uniref:Uncharacterized protein n=1 Tax=Nocardia wallacei TaxID=480035 RepID=A0A7G1KM13_9NOCA|nr:hypothetical protein NWFMUON74_21360 [Nocardia wallacei]
MVIETDVRMPSEVETSILPSGSTSSLPAAGVTESTGAAGFGVAGPDFESDPDEDEHAAISIVTRAITPNATQNRQRRPDMVSPALAVRLPSESPAAHHRLTVLPGSLRGDPVGRHIEVLPQVYETVVRVLPLPFSALRNRAVVALGHQAEYLLGKKL